VTFFKDFQPTPEQQAAQDQALWEERLHEIYERYFYTGDANALASFIRAGGDLDHYELRNEIAERVAGTKEMKSNRGGPKDERNLTLYLDVCNHMMSERASNPKKRKNLSDAIRQVCSISQPNTDADYDIKAEYRRLLDGSTKRFNKGKKLFIQRFGKPWINFD